MDILQNMFADLDEPFPLKFQYASSGWTNQKHPNFSIVVAIFSSKIICCGVPQGSALDPVVFDLYSFLLGRQ